MSEIEINWTLKFTGGGTSACPETVSLYILNSNRACFDVNDAKLFSTKEEAEKFAGDYVKQPGFIPTMTNRTLPKPGEIIAKKGQKVKFFCCTHDFGSKSSDTWEMDDDCTEDDLEFAAREYAHETKQLEWWYEIVEEFVDE